MPIRSAQKRRTGEMFDWPLDTPPANAYVMDGSIKTVAGDPALAAKLGNKYGGDGVTTFGLPDARERYRRGADAGKGAQPSLTVGSTHADENKTHSHSGITLNTSGGDDGDDSNYAIHGEATGGFTVLEHPSTTGASGGGEVRVKTLVVLPCIWR